MVDVIIRFDVGPDIEEWPKLQAKLDQVPMPGDGLSLTGCHDNVECIVTRREWVVATDEHSRGRLTWVVCYVRPAEGLTAIDARLALAGEGVIPEDSLPLLHDTDDSGIRTDDETPTERRDP
jgi:hypothetical protein